MSDEVNQLKLENVTGTSYYGPHGKVLTFITIDKVGSYKGLYS